MTKNYRRYLKSLALVLGAILLATAATNVIVDPHGVFYGISPEGLFEYRHHRGRKSAQCY